MQVIHHGARTGVTGSCHELIVTDKESVLIDCGMFQGTDARARKQKYGIHADKSKSRDIDNDHLYLAIDFPLEHIESLIVTHVHIDHIGRIPYLLDAGFRKPIYCTVPTAALLPLMLEDAISLGISRKRHVIDGYLREIKRLLRPIEYDQWVDVSKSAQARFHPAGHVLGSAFVEVESKDERFVFSGDLGSTHAPLLNPPQSPERADFLLLESTYGDRLHEDREHRMLRLKAILERTLENAGVTIIPAFSLGRTQELLFEMNYIHEDIGKTNQKTSISDVSILVDSPLAIKLGAVYNRMKDYWGEESRKVLDVDSQPLIFDNLIEIDDSKDHIAVMEKLKKNRHGAIVIAGSGMITGGRVIDYVKNFVNRTSTDILFVGYQAAGTPGRIIQEGSSFINLDHRRFDVRAQIHTITGYSAHADQADLIQWVQKMSSKPKHIRLVHGDLPAKQVLQEKLRELGHEVSLSDDQPDVA